MPEAESETIDREIKLMTSSLNLQKRIFCVFTRGGEL